MSNFIIRGEIKISKEEKFEAIVWIQRKDKSGSATDVIKASSPSIGFQLINNFYGRQIEKWGLQDNG
jgi:two-component sensor histidine kinase